MSQIHQYYQKNYLFCPRCQTKFPDTEEPLHCSNCDFKIYANPAPSTAILVIEDNKILLAKRKFEPKKNCWDTPGGFLNVDESVEQCARREMKEETGLKIKIAAYIGSAPDYYQQVPILTIGLQAEIVSGKMKAQDDVASLHWFELGQTPKNIGFESVAALLKKIKSKYKL